LERLFGHIGCDGRAVVDEAFWLVGL